MRVGVVYDAGSGDWDPKDVAAVLDNVRTVQKALRSGGHETTLIPVTLGDVRWLQKVQRCDVIFNLCEGVNGIARYEDYAVAALDLTRVPFTGCTSWTVTIAHRKHIANTLFAAHGVPVPPFALAKRGVIPTGLKFPVIVKPSGEDASVGIDSGAVCTTRKALKERLAKVAGLWEDTLVQEYVPGREVNVGFVGSEMLPISEINFENMPDGSWPIVTYAAKWDSGSPEDLGTEPVCPAPLGPELARRVASVARSAWQLIGQENGYGRVDIRITPDGQPYVLEVNPNPDISADAGLARMASVRGWDYDTLILKVVDEALGRAERRREAEAQYLKIPV
ncbi:MAG: ATP-grasp domain-containing protein [Gemmatimonadales bacterium]|nr:ATP-grasp domain-containing protein [Gemmatimonadales bacterium]